MIAWFKNRPRGAKRRIAWAHVRREPALADVFEHADRADRVVRAVVDVAVVLQPDLDPIAEPGVGDALAGELVLLARDRDADRVHAVVAGRVQRHAAPTAADVEQPFAFAKVELATDQVVLRPLRPIERIVFVLEHRARIGHRRAEEQFVETIGDVVVRRDGGGVARLAVQPCRAGELLRAAARGPAGAAAIGRW